MISDIEVPDSSIVRQAEELARSAFNDMPDLQVALNGAVRRVIGATIKRATTDRPVSFSGDRA